LTEADVKDWTIAGPKGTEGNYVGRFIDHYRPGKLFIAVFGFSNLSDNSIADVHVAMVTDESGRALDLELPNQWVQTVAKQIIDSHAARPTPAADPPASTGFAPFVYNPEEPEVVTAVP
jgi:hypothetical protein